MRPRHPIRALLSAALRRLCARWPLRPARAYSGQCRPLAEQADELNAELARRLNARALRDLGL